MVLGILFIGLCVSFLRLSQFGVDPFSAMNLGISGFIGWSFGTWQLLVNAIILVVVFFQARSCIGAGTIINMVFVGYIADFICYVANDVVQIQMNLPLRILALLLAQLMAFNPADILTTDTSHDRKTILGNAVLRPFFLKIVYPIGIIQFQSLQSKKKCDSYRFCHTSLNV